MKKYTLEQRAQMLKFYIKNVRSVGQTFRDLRPFYGAYNRPSEQCIRAVAGKFYETFSLLD